MVLEAIASYDLHIWHAFIGMPGPNNDLNVLDASPILSEYLGDDAPEVEFEVDGRKYSCPYWLADGIYPEYKCFVKTFAEPIGVEQLIYAKAQEAVQKDVERAFRGLQARFAIVTRPSRLWKVDEMNEILRCCIILHNMIVADDRETGRRVTPSRFQYMAGRHGDEAHRIRVAHFRADEEMPRLNSIGERYEELVTSSAVHFSLKADLVQHIWRRENLRRHGRS